MLKIGVIDIVSHKKYSKILSSVLAGIMPQVICSWAEELGHEIHYSTIIGYENLPKDLNKDLDIVFISSYTMSAYLAYSISNYYRQLGKITILGGPHARAYSEDSCNYFDYVVGLVDKELIQTLIACVHKSTCAKTKKK